MSPKKFGVLVSLLLLASSALAACSSGSGKPSGSAATVAPSGSAAASASVQPKETERKKIKISIFNPGLRPDAPHVPKEKDPIMQMIEKKLNVDIELIFAPEQTEAKLNALIASGDTPDLISTTRGSAIKYYEQGSIATLDDYLKKTPTLMNYYSKDRWLQMTYKGKTIGVPNIEDVTGKNGYWIRNDWLQKLNLKPPTTTGELLNVMKAFTLNDPDGNGKNDTYGFIGGLTKDGLFALGLDKLFWLFGVYPGMVDVQNNQIVFHNTDPRMKEALAYVNTIISEKYIDPDWVTDNIFSTHDDKMFQGKSGIIIHDWRRMEPAYQEKMKQMGGSVPDWVTIDPPKGPRGDQWLDLDVFQSNIWSVSKKAAADPEKAQRIVEMLEYMYTDKDIYPLMAWGIKDIGWKEVNGKPVQTDKFDAQEIWWVKHWAFVRRGDDPVYFAATNPKTLEYWSLNKKYMHPNNVKPFLVPDPNDTLTADRDKYMNEMLLKFVTGKEPLANWDSYVKTLQDKFKLDGLLANYARQLKEQGILK
ncbi:type 2 periplasmic-binding domain-containing protein [Paenibacillus cymbidii]|uniref:hypothetical protein n=1 Tax=Paenibacillus cymbidii TaxID=1639034 RepID=UPI00108201BB|nr:hypothetical protein [Paenibacillus cymbidii]